MSSSIDLSPQTLALLSLKARSVAAGWPDVAAEDIYQELCLFWLENYETLNADGEEGVGLKDYLEAEDQSWGTALLNKSLERAGNVFARRMTAQIRGHDDFVRYSRRSVTAILPLLFDVTSWSSYAAPEPSTGGGTPKTVNQNNDSLATYADMTAAWQSLGVVDQTLLFHKYVLGGDWMTPCLELLETDNEASVRSRVSKALTRLVRHLAGRPAEVTLGRGRHAISNDAAQNITRSDYQ